MFSVQILGSSSAIPAFGRHLSSQMINHHERLFLIDCGEGTQFQILRYGLRIRRLDVIFISHLHGDHVYGLPGLLLTMSLNARTAPLLIVGPLGLRKFIEYQFEVCQAHMNYPVEYVELTAETDCQTPVYENRHIAVYPIPLQHKVLCYGYCFREKTKRKRFLVHEAEKANIPVQYYQLLKQEVDVTLEDGRHIYAAELLAEPEPEYSYAYCSDTAYCPENLIPHLKDVTTLYHEATFLHDRVERAVETGHSTALQAGQIAAAAAVKQLLIGHFSARYDNLQPLLQEARSVFPATELATEGKMYQIPPPSAYEQSIRWQEDSSVIIIGTETAD